MDQFLVINIVHIRIRASMVRFLDVVIKDLAKVRDRQLLRFLFENLEQFDILGGVQQLPGAIKTDSGAASSLLAQGLDTALGDVSPSASPEKTSCAPGVAP